MIHLVFLFSMINSFSPHFMRAMPVLRCRHMHLKHDRRWKKTHCILFNGFFHLFFLFILNFCSLFLFTLLIFQFSRIWFDFLAVWVCVYFCCCCLIIFHLKYFPCFNQHSSKQTEMWFIYIIFGCISMKFLKNVVFLGFVCCE